MTFSASDDYKCIRLQDEKHPKNFEIDDTDYSVAKWYVYKMGTSSEKTYDIADFNHGQLRQLCLKCNLKGGGSYSIWKARVELATWVNASVVYNSNKIANPFTTAQETRLNTYLRLVNVCFLSSMVQRFVDLNDCKKREDREKQWRGSN